MRRFVLIFAILLAAVLPAVGQNNAFDIDDECYLYFQECERSVGKEGFAEIASLLLGRAKEKGDRKAETLYYVEVLKDLTRSALGKEVDEEYDARVEAAQDELKTIARRYGYSQYYYFSFELVMNYYYNHNRQVKTYEMIDEMQTQAISDGDQYGIWMGYRYFVSLYVNQNDYVSAKRYIIRAIDIYENTDDPIIRRQSACRLYCDLADTYPIGVDSVRINVQKAVDARKVRMDTLRCNYHLAKIAALDKDYAAYRAARDYCLLDPSLSNISATARTLFGIIDSLIDGSIRIEDIPVNRFNRLREIKYIANIAEVYGFKELAFDLEKKLVVREEAHLAELNQSRLSEIEAKMGNKELSADLARRDEQFDRIRNLGLIAGVVVLLVILIILLLHIRSLRNFNNESRKLIEELRDANEKAVAADAAKTRFVQNMSHEVRTPLNAIVGFSQLLTLPDGSFSPEEKDEFAGHIVNNTKMLNMLLDDILNASAMDSGNYSINIEEGECGFMCQAAISSAEHRLQLGVSMLYTPESQDTFTFSTDPRRVQQILINLLTNACKHTTSGEIHLGWSLTENPGEVTFWVTDTGPGVPADKAELIFDRFAKLNNFVQGTGLGLSICRDIAVRMGGRVFLDTTYDKGGARFVFVVPVNPPAGLTPPLPELMNSKSNQL